MKNLRWLNIRWRVLYHRKAIKALKKLHEVERNRVERDIKRLLACLEEGIHCGELDIKKLYGEWEGFYRLRSGELRIIYLPLWEERKLKIYNIVHRSKAYK